MTVRFSHEDYERLELLAGDVPLSAYVRSQALNEAAPRRKRRSAASVADKQMLAQILGLLGQTRIANNLNQLAYHANIGSLDIDDTTKAKIAEAHHHVAMIRGALMTSLGLQA